MARPEPGTRRLLALFAAELVHLRASTSNDGTLPAYEFAGKWESEAAFVEWWSLASEPVCALSIDMTSTVRVRARPKTNEEAREFLGQQSELISNLRHTIAAGRPAVTFVCEGGIQRLHQAEFFEWLSTFDLGAWGRFAGSWDARPAYANTFILGTGERFRKASGLVAGSG